MRQVLVVCTGNICRSPVLERLLARDLDDHGIDVSVTSAGTHAVDRGPDADTVAAAEMAGLDIRDHRGRQLTEHLIDTEGADLVVTLTQVHTRAVVGLRPDAAPRTGTIRELAARLDHGGPNGESPPATAWHDVFATRPPTAVLDHDPRLDVPDPYGRPAIEHVMTVHDLANLSGVVARHLADLGGR